MKRFLLALPILAAACANTLPPELNAAHESYARASHGLAAELAPADLHIAAEQLGVADAYYNEHGDSPEARDLAYAAERRARLAEVRASTVAARQQQADAHARFERLREDTVRIMSAELDASKRQLAVSEAQRQQAQAELSRIASVRQEPRGMVITLSGSVLFVSGKYDLLGQAMVKLTDVANVLTKQDPESKIAVQGYTDSQGSESSNLELSRRRAEAVRAYLVSHGIAPDRITAEGYGPARPVADNASPEGRADNRRVEIVVTPSHPRE
jgi:outer membrane protein OmpA-like peptidoglycan-associated protein